jgi:predicted PurR-regulated permease PerM
METQKPAASPRWNAITKLVVALTLIVILGALVVRFHTVIVPILMAFVLAYLLHPLALLMNRKLGLSWRAAVSIVYLVLVLILLALLTWGGVGLIGQIDILIQAVQDNVDRLPEFIAELSQRVITVGSFSLDLSTFDWTSAGQQVLAIVEPMLGKAGGMVGSLASSAAATLGWTAFIVVVSYFFLFESGGLRDQIIQIEIPGYADDIRRLSRRLGLIWNAYLRGQMIVILSTIIIYSIVMGGLGVRYAVGVALIAGFANILPYVGPAITWITIFLLTYFQASNLFGLAPLAYTVLVLGIAILIDQVYNSLVIPRVMARNLKVHPAAVLISALIAANLLGVLGVILAAPLLATLQLVIQYTTRKMMDREPWPVEDDLPGSPPLPAWLQKLFDARRARRAARLQASPPPASSRPGTKKSRGGRGKAAG